MILKGILSNLVGISILYYISNQLQLEKYAILALSFQYLVFFIHGLPFNSEKFYDASGSLTHLLLIVVSLLENNFRNSR